MMNLEFIYLFTYSLPPRQPTPPFLVMGVCLFFLVLFCFVFFEAITIMRRAAAVSLSVKSNVLGNDCAP